MHFVAFWGVGCQSRREFHDIFLNIDHVLGRNNVHNIFLGFRNVVLEIFNVNVLGILCTLQ